MIKAIIIDDEAPGRQVLKNMLADYCPEVKVVSTAGSVQEGLNAILRDPPEVVFLDIEMPEQNGFDLLKYFDAITFEIVFVTAYNKYALKAFEFSALDYLLKPINPILLRKAVVKVIKQRTLLKNQQHYQVLRSNLDNGFHKLTLPTTEGYIFIDIQDIVHLKADGNYCSLFMLNAKKHFVSKNLGELESLLENANFFRIQRSHLINLNHIRSYTRARRPVITMVNDIVLTLSAARKKAFLDKLSLL